jgi:hypothetical protein
MSKHFTPHLITAGVLLFLALCATFSAIVNGPGSYPMPVTDLKIATINDDKAVLGADMALQPLVANLSGRPDSNPFILRKTGAVRGPKIPFPPPPPVAVPAPPILPLAEK